MPHLCERCQQEFECQSAAIAACQCSQWQLSPTLRAQVAEQYHDCLCGSCLQQLGAVGKTTSFVPINSSARAGLIK